MQGIRLIRANEILNACQRVTRSPAFIVGRGVEVDRDPRRRIRVFVAHPIVEPGTRDGFGSYRCQKRFALATVARRPRWHGRQGSDWSVDITATRGEGEIGRRVGRKFYGIDYVAILGHREGYSPAVSFVGTGESVGRSRIAAFKEDFAAVVNNGIRAVANTKVIGVRARAAIKRVIAIAAP